MLTTMTPCRARRFSVGDQARAFATVLREEFGVALAFYDATTGERVPVPGSAELTSPCAEWEQALVLQLAKEDQAQVTPLGEGSYQLALLLHESGEPILIAVGALAALTHTQAEALQEQARLQKWLQSVQERLCGANQSVNRHRAESRPEAQAAIAWQTLLTLDHLTRRLRIHKDTVKNQKRILQAAAELLKVGTLIWVPQQGDGTILIQGEPCLSLWDCRQLATLLGQCPEGQKSGFILWNQLPTNSGGKCFPQISNLMALPVTAQGPPGWMIALNRKLPAAAAAPAGKSESPEGRPSSGPLAAATPEALPFRRSDLALLTPFVGLLGLHQRACGRYAELKELLVGLTRSLTAAIDAKDSYTYGHSERVARIAIELGREMRLPEEELSDIYLAGLLHDIGKIGIRDSVLCKREPLTPEETEHIRQHVTIGYNILAGLRAIRHLLPGVLYHHERYDGKGYPEGLQGNGIPLLARILAVADSYDAMSTSRPYRAALPRSRVEEILTQGAGTQWDREIVQAFLHGRQKIYLIHQQGLGESLAQALDGALRSEDSVTSVALKPAQ